MRADTHDGREQTFPSKGRIQMRKTNNLQISQIQLAPHGRSIHMGQKHRFRPIRLECAPWAGQVSGGGFDSLPGVMILELCWAEVAERGV